MRRPIHEITVAKDASWATVHTRVDRVYRDFLEEVNLETKNDEQLFEAHVKLVIWGVLFVEGLVNFKLYEITKSEFATDTLIDTYWALTKQARIENKMDFVLKYGKVRRDRFAESRAHFVRMVDKRNRLVHYKDVPTDFDFKVLRSKLETNAPLQKWIDNAPNPKIVNDLFSMSLAERKKIILHLGDLLELVKPSRG